MADTLAEDADLLTGIAPCLRFIPTKGLLAMQEGEDWGSPGLTLHFDLKLRSEEEIEAEHDRQIDLGKTAEWGLSLYRGMAEGGNLPKGAVGRINYSKEYDRDGDFSPETSSVWAHLEAERFDLLASLVSQGRLPSSISVTAAGLEYGSAPDGSVKRWNVRERPNLLVKALAFGYSTHAPGLDERWVEEVPAPIPVTAKDIETSSAALALHLSELRGTAKLILWALVAIGLIALFK